MQNLKKVQICAEKAKRVLLQRIMPKIGIVLGTGLGNLEARLEDAAAVAYTALPDFPQSTAPSHAGRFVSGRFAGVPVIMQQGRCHLYEGKTPGEVVTGVRVMAMLGVQAVLLTNAAGALNPLFNTGSLMLIEDHINFTGKSPLTGPNIDAWGPRFPDMSRVYDPDMGACLEKAALELGMRLEKGVYIGIHGPQLETRAETRLYRSFGVDAIGMSTVLEAIAARHMGLRIAGIASLTNLNSPDCMAEASIESIIAMAEKSGEKLESLLMAALPKLAALVE